MRNLFILALLLALPAAAAEPVAIVYSLAGEAALMAPDPRPLRLFDRLPAGTVVEVSPGARMALVFVSGRRYELGESRVALGPKDFTSRIGTVRALPRVPPLPRLLPIAKEDRPGPKAGAVRIRSEEMRDLSPDGTAALADATILRFRPAGGAARHHLEIEDVHGAVIFRSDTETSDVQIPAGILAPGSSYHWTVTALGTHGPAVRGKADFVTLSRKAAMARERWRKAVETLEDGSAEALLKAVDHGLGLISAAETGVVVEHVTPASAGERAGLQPEDTILSWSCAASPPAFPQASGGAVRSPYDLLPLEVEEAPRRAVTLRGRRGGQGMTWTLTAAEWGIKVRPDLSSDLAGDARLAAWSLDRLAAKLDKAGKFPEADAAYEEAVTALNRETESMAAASLLLRWGLSFENRSAWDAAVERYESSLALARTLAPKSLLEARASNALGIVAAKRGDYLAAQELLQQALTIREELAPGTTEVTGSLNNLGILARRSGALARAEEYLTRGEELQRRLAPNTADHALFFQNLGNLAANRGDFEEAESFHRQALAIFEKTAPAGDGVASCLGNLANIALHRGYLATAEDLYRRSLALQEQSAPDALGASTMLISLGNVASRRGDLDAAETYYRRALGIQEKLSPQGWEAAASLSNLGHLAATRGDFATARTYLLDSLVIMEKLAPEALDVAAILEQLGRVETESGADLATAEDLLRQALTIYEKQFPPKGLEISEVLRDLGEVAARRGLLPNAIAFHRQALALQRRLAPETTGEAEALHFLGRAERRAGLNEQGTRDLCLAIDVLDHQRSRIGGTQEARSSFESTLGDYYQACLEGLMELGRPAEAFQTLERGRARSFLALLAERDLRLAGLPPDLAAERRHLNADYDRVQSQLNRLSPARDGAEIERLTTELRDLRARQEDVIARMRREAPRSAAIEYPEPLAAADARAVLDPGTVLLAYAVGAERSWLFVVEPTTAGGPGLSVFPIPIQEKALREQVESFRRLLKRSGSERATVHDQARRLYNLLVRPAQARLSGAQRLLISADGPLHTLPFAALMRGERYLVEWKPLHSVLSATVYSEMVRSRPARQEPGEERLAAFGDPMYPPAPDAPSDLEVRAAVERGLALKPLPSARKEVEALAAIFPQTQVYLGQEATEERAKAIAPEARLIHFACHGLLDERFPLNSALALTIPERPGEGQDNGLLQAWEIFESARLDADLVTLSACESALGKEMGGEGLLGLTRAFQYAGARSVLASLWSVSDDSTSDLMKRFYGYLRDGRSKDEALRAAQVELIRSRDFAHPYHWAAFQLTGDWR